MPISGTEENSFLKQEKIENVEESRQRDMEISNILGKPFEDQAKVISEMIKIESTFFSLLDLLYEIWDSLYSVSRNLRLIIACISKYLTNQKGKIDSDTYRIRHDMKNVLKKTYDLWVMKYSMSLICNKAELYNFIRYEISHKLYASFVNRTLKNEIFNEWICDYKKYIKNLSRFKTSKSHEKY